MDADLTLPGTIPGLLRKGSPVVASRLDGLATDEPVRGVVVGPWTDGLDIAWADYTPLPELIMLASGPEHVSRGRSGNLPPDLALDLADATGRAHAAWWLAAAWSCPGPCDAGLAVLGRGWQVAGGPGTWGRWLLPTDPGSGGKISGRYGDGVESPIVVVPSLAGLDPADPRLLPDGSRWVDAEALRRVVCHVAGVPDGR